MMTCRSLLRRAVRATGQLATLCVRVVRRQPGQPGQCRPVPTIAGDEQVVSLAQAPDMPAGCPWSYPWDLKQSRFGLVVAR
jgi:hypothetical protein